MKTLIWCLAGIALTQATQECSMDRNDRVFCNALNTVCYSSRTKDCLARSLQQCLPDAELPVETLASLYDYVDVYINSVKPKILPPITPPTDRIGLIYDTGVHFIDYIFSYMSTFPNDQIQKCLMNRISLRYYDSVTLAFQDADLIIEKIKYIFENFSVNTVDTEQLQTILANLYQNHVSHYYWFSNILDGLLSDLEIRVFEDPEYFNYDWYNILEPSNKEAAGQQVYCHQRTGEERSWTCEKYCLDSYGGNWILIQSRDVRNEATRNPFDKSYIEYEVGFGDTSMGYWMGLACLNSLTMDSNHELLIELTNANGQVALAHYDQFGVGSAASGYPFNVGRFLGGAAGDAFGYDKDLKFSAKDWDSDDELLHNCASSNKGGWWYSNCRNSLNGEFNSFYEPGLTWDTFDTYSPISKTRMMIRASENGGSSSGVEMLTIGMIMTSQTSDGVVVVQIEGGDQFEDDLKYLIV